MGLIKPFFRTCRQFTDGRYAFSGHSEYISDPRYAKFPEQYIRAYLIIQKDLLTLFDYVEPADKNLLCYSYRINELMLRSCIEIEANCKAILLENGYKKNAEKLNMVDFQKIENSHQLSSYMVKLPYWFGKKNKRKPFLRWKKGDPLAWYQAYNTTKHDRHSNFPMANLDNLLDAICALVALLSAQFYTYDFSPSPGFLIIEGPNDGTESAIGDYFRVAFPSDLPKKYQYDFEWSQLVGSSDPFVCFPY